MMKISRFLVATLLCGALSSPVVVAQSAPSSLHVSPEWSETQRAKVRFVHGFYTAYMSGIVYQVDGLTDVLLKAYVDAKVWKKNADADVLLDAQDCIEENMQTLKVLPLDDDWCKVSFLWTSPYPDVPTREHVLHVKVKEQGKRYRIAEVKVEQ